DPKIATQNLDADMISKVQVYDDRENDPDHLVPEYEVKKIINLKFKKAFKKSVIGNVDAGAGTQDRYDAGGFLSKFQEEFQLSAHAGSDNLSGTRLFLQDMHMPVGSSGGGGTTEANIANINFNDKIGKNLKLNLEYELNDRISTSQQSSQQQQFIGDTTFNTVSGSNRHNHQHDQGLHIKADWTPDTLTTIKFYPNMNYSYNGSNNNGTSNASTNFVDPLNQNISTDHSTDHSFQYDHTLSYYRRLNKKGASFNISNGLSIHPDRSIDYNFNNLISYSTALPSDTISRSSRNTNTDYSASLSAGYHDPLTKKLSLDVAVIGYHDRNEGDLLTYDEDFKTGLYSIFNAEQSSDLVRYVWQQTLHPDLTYNFSDKVSLKAGFEGQLQQIDNHFSNTIKDLNQHFAYLLPAAELHISSLNLNYSEDIRQPGINQLQPITITYSPLYTFIGNPDLKPTRLHNVGLNFNHFYPESQMFIGIFGRVTVETNTILNEKTVDAEGATITTPINRNGRFTTSLNGFWNKSFKKQGDWGFSLSSNAYFITGHNFFEVNGKDGYQNTTAIIFTQQVSANWKEIIEIKPSYSINSAITKYQLVNYNPSSYTSQTATLSGDLFLPKKFVWSVDYAYKYNPLVEQGFQRSSNILGLSVARHIQEKDKGEFRLTCYDIFNQGVSSYHYASENTINDSQTLLLRRYFLLSYTYRFTTVTNK
ncbi:MAG: outer membrane beta-barrel protein, partial [Sphingobacteriales bacterium]